MQAQTEQLRRGVVEYRGDVGLRGRETFTVSRAPDGTMTLQAHCRMYDTRVERWVVHTVDGSLRPLRSYVSQRRAGEFLGEGRFLVEPDAVIASTRVAGMGEVTQRVPVDGPLDYFVPHAVAADSWITPHHPPGEQGWREVLRGYTTSLLPDGSTGPLTERHGGLRLRWEGKETIEVPAGAFDVDHFVVSARPGVEEHLWVSADHWATLVKLRSDRLATTYVLTELSEEPMWPAVTAGGATT
ncbi:hypothetical protein [Nocardioides gilvus]|uniref:hypothetical protein n=1 Tax=Nocardioides gilvus TaxID=1735589 RepID=UPI000D74CD56|nr:hypothetical protein [Nocardioides gilvus]